MAYGELKVDTITFTNGGTDTSVAVSGLVLNPTFSGDITSTGTISGDIILGGTTVSGATVSGGDGIFVSGVFTTQISGATITGNTVKATSITGVNIIGTTSVSGATITGGTIVGTTTVSGATVTGNAVQGTTITGGTVVGTTTVSGATVTGTAGNFTNITGGASTFTSNVTLNAQSDLRFADSDSSNWVAFQAPATVSSNVTWTLPSADGSTGQVLSTDGTGTLSWATAGGGGGGELQQDAYNNLYAGDNALSSWTGTSLSYNIAIGESAALDLTDGQRNVIIGYLGGQDITTADDNIAIGSLTFTSTAGATGNFNICLGQYTGYKITAGNNNICMGRQAGDALTTGANNVIIGELGGSAIDTESKNTVVGATALRFSTSGSQNAILGYGSGDYCQGSNNTILGFEAQHNTSMNGSNNTVIGALATASSTSVSNEITLGDSNITKLRVPGVSFEVSGGQVSANAYTETVYNLTGTVIDPANGAIQTKTLAANTTFTESLSAGESVLIMIDDGTAYTVTWPTTTWVGGSAPTLATSGYTVVELWKVSTTLYGAHVGDVA